ncbi:hypothetical protein VE01_09366 [Pseudogymnoascus verrucosus]|uniref:Long-chain-alcohol oxidase n=1 Tax=Pseudogymnoascus verrucosus TaxID=342668 RepID=A0A1B8G7H2_9PEZI|nr:uncharacterized protein VE01_09366 [Pseudogymnoascus verrucosus]OBT91780.1 hypothetical protein VE01_09366 [Pseudogymnoascus verrucosus]
MTLLAVIPPKAGSHAPIAVALPDPPASEAFTEGQWTSLLAIMDTVVPSVRRDAVATDKINQHAISDVEYAKAAEHLQGNVSQASGTAALDAYLEERPSDNPQFCELLMRTLVVFTSETARKRLSLVLSALDTRVGSLILTGSPTPFTQQPLAVRELILQRWRLSYIPALNGFYKQMTVAAKNLWIKTSPSFYHLSGFPQFPPEMERGKLFPYEFLKFTANPEPEVIETDIVVVGSGCGGGVCAKNLAEAGLQVLVVDRAYFYPTETFPMSEEAGMVNMFDNGGSTFSDDGSIAVVSGSTWGGGGTVNWSAALQTQGFVRKEWAQDRGLTFFETSEFQNCLDRVCYQMGVSAEHIRHNHGNNVLLDGARKMGYAGKAVPQNTGNKEHYCGHCSLGCAAAEKQGPTVAWLPDAARAGAKFIEGFTAHHVLFDESSGQKTAVGVEGTWVSRNSRGGVDGQEPDRTVRKVIVKAKKVIVSCGALWSPILLLQSGLKNRHIGRNLYLHPVNIISGLFKEDVRPWEGGILTSVVSSFEDLDGHGHGAKLEAMLMIPSLAMSMSNVTVGLDFKKLALKFRHTNSWISLARDRDSGRVYPDPNTGGIRIEYTPSAFDRQHILTGCVALAKIAYTEGAIEIHTSIPSVAPFIRNADEASIPSTKPEEIDPGVSDPRFQAWLKELWRADNKPPGAGFASAHQMGTNRMSIRESDGVVDPKGKVWGTEGLYVSDASVFPSASGVNPMVTIMAISDWISRNMSNELRSADGKLARL